MKYVGSRAITAWLLVLGLLAALAPARAQTVISLDSTEAQTLRRHPRLRQSDQEIEEQRALKRGSFAPANPDFLFSAPTGEMWAPGVVQTIDFPTVYRRQANVARAGIALAERNRDVSRATVLRDAREAYLGLQFAEAQVRQLTYQDSLYQVLQRTTERLFAAGEVTSLQRISTAAEARLVAVQLQQAIVDQQAAQRRLGLLLGRPGAPLATSTDLRETGPALALRGSALLSGLPVEDSSALVRSPTLAAAAQNVTLSQSGISLVRARRTPALTLGYQNQAFENSALRYRFQFGVSVPIWFWTYRSQLRAATARASAASYQLETQRLELGTQYQQALADTRKFATTLTYYEQTGLPQSRAIISQSQRLFRAGEISYLVLIQSLNQAFTIQNTYLTTIRDYSQGLVELNFLRGE
ncbi:outer membrane efflux protein [Hymenobacter roseosalivarius DSM 11622]|uniref:Outer membrane efflux protein n=1 Tax=Hymenobacter roseosalivarius DSM 11622 TaxID=645990 RepID=A0A1W1USA2_9BACT|nr:TolC family protein [Hymenobacter roseosalivarius]SMB83614.1 outer membrane efflux protein [Hymenobacter roseosalivarius DSM 11622]